MGKKYSRYDQAIDALETLNELRISKGKCPLIKFWTGVAHRLLVNDLVGGQRWIPELFFKDEALLAAIEILLLVETGEYDKF